ncbi:MAG: substrate-binding domain-containing protein [Anaerolineales bacterium]|nr:substrate-binding domain-containing protein [Anaerolineales bacterium]
MLRQRIFIFLILVLVVSSSACTPTPKAPAVVELILATTTSTQDSGLLDILIPAFEQQTGYIVKVVAVGSGQAMKMGEEGNADVLLVHAPASEVDFMANGFGAERKLVMHNDFIFVGPASDPAGIKGAATSVDALKKIAEAQAVFLSRGDDSGTHKMELILWKAAGITPEGAWYQETGQGMGATLKIASEKAGYTLADRATYLATQDTLQLEILLEGDKALLNVYHVITVNPAKWPKVNAEGATAFMNFMVSDETQKIIGEFGQDKYGQSLFFPDADKTDADLGL